MLILIWPLLRSRVNTIWRQCEDVGVRAINSCKSQIYMRGTTKIRATFYWLSRSSRIWRVAGADRFILVIIPWHTSSVINVYPEAKALAHFNWNCSCWKNGVKDCCSVYVKLYNQVVACKFPSHTKSETVNNFFWSLLWKSLPVIPVSYCKTRRKTVALCSCK